jgi:hypothetical protein
MTTATATESVQKKLEKSNLNDLADALRKVGPKRHSVIKAVVTGLGSTTGVNSVDITAATTKAAATITGIDTLRDGVNLPAIGKVLTLRVTAVPSSNYAATGARAITDASGTASSTRTKISNDGKTLTFESGKYINGFTIQYTPRSESDLTAAFAPNT